MSRWWRLFYIALATGMSLVSIGCGVSEPRLVLDLSGKRQMLRDMDAASGDLIDNLVVSPDGRHVVMTVMNDSTWRDLLRLDLQTGEVRLFWRSPVNMEGRKEGLAERSDARRADEHAGSILFLPRFRADGRAVLCSLKTRNLDGPDSIPTLFEIAFPEGTARIILGKRDGLEPRAAAYLPGGGLLVEAYDPVSRRNSFYELTSTTSSLRRLWPFPPHGYTWHLLGNMAVVETSMNSWAPNPPKTIRLLDLASGATDDLIPFTRDMRSLSPPQPGVQEILYEVSSGGRSAAEIWAVDIATKVRRKVLGGKWRNPTWLPGGKQMLVVDDRTGSSLWLVHVPPHP